MELPGGGPGYWPAFWTLGEPFRTKALIWPTTGEIDIMENINNTPSIHGTLHCGTLPGGPCNEPSGRGSRYNLSKPAGAAGPHTYTIIWDTQPQRIRWYVDSEQYWEVTDHTIGEKAWNQSLGHGFFLLLNVTLLKP